MPRIEFDQPVDNNSNRFAALRPVPGGTQKITTTNETTAFADDAIVRVVCDGDSNIDFGPSAEAAVTDTWMPDNHVEYFKVLQGDKIGVIGGTMYVDIMK